MRTRAVAAAIALMAVVAGCQHPHHNHPTLSCVRHNESRGDYSAQNPRSSASGAYQFIDGTWRSVTREMGRGGEYSRAKHAPEYYQDMVAYWAMVDPGKYRSHWTGKNRGC